ncbi:PTS sugar transporter subunit IIA [Gemmatimonadota bacterium]
MSEGGPVQGVLLAHGAMARGMADAVGKISGVEEGALSALSNEGKSPETLHDELDVIIGSRPAVVFTDLASGSCALAARICCREGENRAVVSGVNLPMLLDFVFHRHLSLDELVPRLLEKGKGSLKSTPEYPDHAHCPE